MPRVNLTKELAAIIYLFLFLFLASCVQGSGDPDLSVKEDDIYFSSLNPTSGVDIVIYAVVDNEGIGARAFVRFYVGSEKNLIGEDKIEIGKDASALASISWKPSYGINNIYVSIEDVTPSDVDLGNNEVNVTVELSQEAISLELTGGMATIEEGIDRIIPINVKAYNDISNVSIDIIYHGEINVTLVSPQLNISAGETNKFYIKIKVPHLEGDDIYDNRTILLQARNEEYVSNIAELTISIHPSVEESTWWIPTVAAATAGTIGIFTLLGSTEIGKYKFLTLVFPLYTKLNRKEILDHYTRGKIHGYILANPGDNYNSIKKALDISNGSFAYHLHVLEREEVIKSKRDGIYKRFYPSEMRIPYDHLQLKEIQRLILEKIKETPGISQTDIAAFLGVASSTIHYHIQDLIKDDIIDKKRNGRKVGYFPNDGF